MEVIDNWPQCIPQGKQVGFKILQQFHETHININVEFDPCCFFKLLDFK